MADFIKSLLDIVVVFFFLIYLQSFLLSLYTRIYIYRYVPHIIYLQSLLKKLLFRDIILLLLN